MGLKFDGAYEILKQIQKTTPNVTFSDFSKFLSEASKLGYVDKVNNIGQSLGYTKFEFTNTIASGAGTELATSTTSTAPTVVNLVEDASTLNVIGGVEGFLGCYSLSQLFVGALAAVGGEVVGLKVGENIAEQLPKLVGNDQFWYDYYSALEPYTLVDEVAGLITATDEKLTNFLSTDILEKIHSFFAEKGVYDDGTVTYDNFTEGSNTITNLFDYNILFNEANKLATAEKFKPNYILNKAREQGYDVPEITPNDLVVWVQTYGYSVSYIGHLFISKDVLNKTFNISEATNMPNSNKLFIPFNDFIYKITIDIDEKITYEHLTNPTGNNIFTINWAVPRYSIWNLGTAESSGIEGIKFGDNKADKNKTLAEQFPDWFAKSKTINGIDSKTGNKTQWKTLPLTLPATKYELPTITDPKAGTITDPISDEAIKKGSESIGNSGGGVPTVPPQKPTTPTPIVVPPSTSEIGLHKIYTPNDVSLRQFNDFLWNKNLFVDAVAKLYQDPFDAIISLHRVYCSVDKEANAVPIVIGKISVADVVSHYTNKQYYSLDCGTISIDEYYSDCRDYDGFTQIQIFLPFIGFKTLNTNEVMNSKLNVTYKIDILTGNCIAMINVIKYNISQCMYTFNGNCAEQVPLSGSNYTSLITSTAFSIVGGATTGGVGGAIVSGTSALAGGLGHTVERSGALDCNFGALGIKKPYIIINRSIASESDNYNKFYGYPASKTLLLGSCNGYTRVKSVHVEGIICTDEEKNMIESQLKQGVFV